MLHIRVIEGDGAIHTSGGRSTRGLLVEITDETGRPVDGAAVSFRLPEEGPGGTFVHGMRTEIQMTTPDGRAGVREFLPGRNAGPFQVRVTAVRDSIRAGTVIDQYISEATQTSSRAKAFTSASPEARSGISKKWVIWLAIGGGAVAAALVAGSSSHGGSSGPVVTPPVAVIPPPTIGAPVLVIGRPQ